MRIAILPDQISPKPLFSNHSLFAVAVSVYFQPKACSFRQKTGFFERNSMSSSDFIDDYDRNILRVLQRDGRCSNAALAREVNLSESACLRRLRRLEDSGVIEAYTAKVNASALDLAMSVFVTLSLTEQSQAALNAFEAAVAQIPEVMECYLMTGSSDYLLRMVARDVADLERLHAQRLTRIPGVSRVTSSIAMRTVVKRTGLPL